jgi:anti-sigma factor RsiW
MTFACDQVQDRLSPFLDDELEAAEIRAIRAHLGSCASCAGALARLERLEALSAEVLGAAPAIGASEWRVRSARVEAASKSPRMLALRQHVVRRTIARFAVAAALFVASTLALPLLLERIEGEHLGHLCFSHKPGSNEAEVLEAWGETDDHWIHVDYPKSEGDAVVIMVSKL